MIENKEVMAKNIQRLMDYNNVKAVDVCNAIDCKANTFSDWIHAKSYPRIDKIEKMARYFNVSKAELVEDISKQPILTDIEIGMIEHMRQDKSFQDRIMAYAKFLLSEGDSK